MESINNHMKEVYIIVAVISIVLFLLAGYVYPPTAEDIGQNRAFPFKNNSSYDRGLLTQFFTSLVFVGAVLLLGLYVNSTFVKFNVKNWGIFALGIYLMLLYGLGKIGELTYNHNFFDDLKDLLLPFALMVLAYASYKISTDIKGGK